MRRILTLISCIMLLSSPAMADGSFSVEAFFKNLTLIDAKNQNGGGGTVLIDLDSRLKAAFSGSYTYYDGTKEIVRKDFDISYSHMVFLAGVSYEPPVSFLDNYRLVWRNSLYCGYSRTEISIEGLKDASASDSGFAVALNTGIGYNWSQNFQFFIDVGWQHSFYQGDFRDYDISGVQAQAGVRYSPFNSKTLGEDF